MPADNIDLADFMRGLVSNFKTAATRPNINGYQPHYKQGLFHNSPDRGRLYIAGNRAGKTTAGIVEDIWWCLGNHPYQSTPEPPVRGRIVGVDFANGIEKIIKPELQRWVPLTSLRGGAWSSAYSSQMRTLHFQNGSFIELMSYDQDLDKFAGTSRHFVHFDEEPPNSIFTECKARLVDTAGNFWMTLTPVEGMSWIYDDIYLPGKNDPLSSIAVVEADITDNPHISREEIENFLSALSPEERLVRGQGKFVQLGGLVYKAFDSSLHVIDDLDINDVRGRGWHWYCSLDHGFNNPTAVLWHAVNDDQEVITFAEHYENEKTIDYHAKKIHDYNASFGRKPDIYVCDPALAQRQAVTGTSIQNEYAIRDIPFALGNNDVMTGIAKVSQYLQLRSNGTPSWRISRNCPNLIREMQRLRWKTWATKKAQSENNKYDIIHKKDDHACDSTRYFFSLMPDLRLFKSEPKKRQPPNAVNAKLALEAGQIVIDPNLTPERLRATSMNPTTEWTVIDEHMGGLV